MEINQTIVAREIQKVDYGTMGFPDYVTEKENFVKFASRVTKIANDINKDNCKVLGISYPTEDIAVICYIAE